MSKIAKHIAAGVFLTLWKATGYRVKKITRFSGSDDLKTIAIFSTTALGDFLINTPAINAIKTRWPEARLLLVVNERNKGLAVGSPLFDEIYYWNGKANGVLKLSKTLRKRRVDATFILHSRVPYDIIVASLARSRYIFKDVYYSDYQNRDTFLLKNFLSAHYDNRQNGNLHHIHQKTRLLSSIGIDIPSEEMFIPAPYTKAAPDQTVIGIHAGASQQDRCWPVEKFTQLIQSVLEAHPEVTIELIGSAGEKALNQRIIDGLPYSSDRVRNVAGTTNLQQLATKITSFTCLVVGDTGPLHVAIAVKTPVVGLFGGQMYVDGAAPLQDHEIHHVIMSKDENAGLRAISVAEVKAAIDACIRQKAPFIR
ncbi:glycosyltransferase family 9 protein [Cronobacter dublinensis]|uniref:glycosyltransferase family 9 protein n=1 Tax=Cronobacter dublinensis TaxID=413497 RepID=UPI000CFE4482|nr:glycosyltransferase family 9 protein [Cronobacter dublinensis]EKK4081074.1 glycosyltransferase family 9 protein [Cronobacter dublinensis]ELY2906453.1 glycosyltransferase family 9 protein [Cronobacter dublinensis]NCH72297.1 glycosyltransferase family 9 protein [Cronobacter dublinensis]NHV91080.1 glycosyltransferase family 9 protein [Cronobacter dublinensis]